MDIIILLLIAVCLVFIFLHYQKGKKKSSCSQGCMGCPYANGCKKDKKEPK